MSKRDALWTRLDEEQERRVLRGFENDEPPITLRRVPTDDFMWSAGSLTQATSNVRRGDVSRTRGPISISYDPDKNTFFVIDGHHHLAEALLAKKKTIDVKIVRSGYSDYYATP
jgi:hypothetical protein